METCSERPACVTTCRNTPSAVGERQMFPVQMNSTLACRTSGRLDEETLLQRLQAVAQLRGAFELEVARGLQHLPLDPLQFLRQRLLAHRVVALLRLRGFHLGTR